MINAPENVSTFALIVDKLRTMDEAELKLAWLRLFKNELSKEWEKITTQIDFSNVSDEEIVAAIQSNRYGKSDV